jgi:hypothetical protein
MGPTLQTTLDNLRRLLESHGEISSPDVAEILGLLRAIEVALLARQIQRLMPTAGPATAADPEDRWLTPHEVAERLKHSRAWVYRQARHWPFAKRPSRKTLLISDRGLTRWLEHR